MSLCHRKLFPPQWKPDVSLQPSSTSVSQSSFPRSLPSSHPVGFCLFFTSRESCKSLYSRPCKVFTCESRQAQEKRMVDSFKSLFAKIMEENNRSSKQQRSYVAWKKSKYLSPFFALKMCSLQPVYDATHHCGSYTGLFLLMLEQTLFAVRNFYLVSAVFPTLYTMSTWGQSTRICCTKEWIIWVNPLSKELFVLGHHVPNAMSSIQ